MTTLILAAPPAYFVAWFCTPLVKLIARWRRERA